MIRKTARNTLTLALLSGGLACADSVVSPGTQAWRGGITITAAAGSGQINAALIKVDGGRVDSVTAATSAVIVRQIPGEAKWLIASSTGLPSTASAILWGPGGGGYSAIVEEGAGADWSLIDPARIRISVAR